MVHDEGLELDPDDVISCLEKFTSGMPLLEDLLCDEKPNTVPSSIFCSPSSLLGLDSENALAEILQSTNAIGFL